MEVQFSEHGIYELMLMQLQVKLKYSETVIVEKARIMETKNYKINSLKMGLKSLKSP